jgi:predicted DNA-binding transcriptional regulator AlpA
MPNPTNIEDTERAVTARDVARLLGLAEITVAQQRARGEGPPFFKIGRHVRYRLADVIAWRDARTVGRNP